MDSVFCLAVILLQCGIGNRLRKMGWNSLDIFERYDRGLHRSYCLQNKISTRSHNLLLLYTGLDRGYSLVCIPYPWNINSRKSERSILQARILVWHCFWWRNEYWFASIQFFINFSHLGDGNSGIVVYFQIWKYLDPNSYLWSSPSNLTKLSTGEIRSSLLYFCFSLHNFVGSNDSN